jgi:hypothetical protein
MVNLLWDKKAETHPTQAGKVCKNPRAGYETMKQASPSETDGRSRRDAGANWIDRA